MKLDHEIREDARNIHGDQQENKVMAPFGRQEPSRVTTPVRDERPMLFSRWIEHPWMEEPGQRGMATRS